MTVNLSLSNTSGGSPLSDLEDMGDASPDGTASFQDVFISHDAVAASITDVALYVTRCVSTSYLGADADADITEMFGWGDAGTGGIKIVMDGWGTWIIGTENDTGTWNTIRNGYGDIDNQIILPVDAITSGTIPSNPGEIPVGSEAHIQVKVDIPSSVPAGANYRAFSLVIAYSATS